MSHCYLNLWLLKLVFQHSLLNLWPYATEMWEPVCLRCTTLQVCRNHLFTSETTSSSSSTSSRGLHLSDDWKDGSRKEPDPGCKVDEADSPLKLCDGPLGMQICVASHCRGEAFFSHRFGDEPSGNASSASSEFPHRRPSWSFGLCSLHCCRCQLLMGGPSAGDRTHCPVLVLTMPIALPNGWRCFYPLPCLHRRLLRACEYLWLICFVPKETQLLLSV
jgi:hypothetical protein